jgi:hypothetical protein
MSEVGFIILRHVNNHEQNQYWIHCYKCIREYYKENKILIIDDNSNYKFITNEILYKTLIIQSEFPKRGELLPYYYFLQNNLFDIAVIIHDSVFFNSYIDFSLIDKYKILWEFEHNWDKPENEIKLIKKFNNKDLLDFYNNKNLWKGCFGGMTVISHKYLVFINKKFNLSNLLEYVVNREDRMAFERVIACLLQINCRNQSLLGIIHKYCRWGIKFKEKDKFKNLPIIKTWSGR